MASQNLLLVGGEIDTQACILLSIINSWRKIDTKLSNFEIWAHEQYPTFKRYKDRWQQAKCESDIRKITERTEKLIDNLSNSITTNKLIVCMGLDFCMMILMIISTYQTYEKQVREVTRVRIVVLICGHL